MYHALARSSRVITLLSPTYLQRKFCEMERLLARTRRREEAERPLRRALEIDEAHYGNDHPEVAIDLMSPSEVLAEIWRHNEALSLLRRAHSILTKRLPDGQTRREHVQRKWHRLEAIVAKLRNDEQGDPA